MDRVPPDGLTLGQLEEREAAAFSGIESPAPKRKRGPPSDPPPRPPKRTKQPAQANNPTDNVERRVTKQIVKHLSQNTATVYFVGDTAHISPIRSSLNGVSAKIGTFTGIQKAGLLAQSSTSDAQVGIDTPNQAVARMAILGWLTAHPVSVTPSKKLDAVIAATRSEQTVARLSSATIDSYKISLAVAPDTITMSTFFGERNSVLYRDTCVSGGPDTLGKWTAAVIEGLVATSAPHNLSQLNMQLTYTTFKVHVTVALDKSGFNALHAAIQKNAR